MPDKNEIMDINSSCDRDIKLKRNCHFEDCDGLIVKGADIYQAECVPVLSERMYDCLILEDSKYRVKESEEFIIVSTTKTSYDEGDPICIEKIGVKYDFIGILEDEKQEIVDSEDITFLSLAGSGYNCCDKTFYDEFIGIIVNKCDKGKEKKCGIKSRVLESDVQFHICNLEIIVTGKIGSKPFKAISASAPFTGKIFEGCGLDFYGKICLPRDAKKVTIHEEYEGCLNVECVTTKDVYDNCHNSFTADVELELSVKKNIYSTVTEKMAIFAMPESIKWHCGEEDDEHKHHDIGSYKNDYFGEGYYREEDS